MDQEEPAIPHHLEASFGPAIRNRLQEIAEFTARYPSLREQFEVLARVLEQHRIDSVSQHQYRIASLARECLRTGYSERLTRAIIDYLTGAGSLEQLDQPWPAAGENTKDVFWPLVASDRDFQPRDQDALDLRILDVCLHQHQLASFLRAYAGDYAGDKERRRTRLQQICEHLRSREVDVQTFLNLLADGGYGWASDQEGNLTPLGDLIRPYLAAHLERFDDVAEARHWRGYLIQLLLAGPSPLLDEARDIAERDGQGAFEARFHGPCGLVYYDWALGQHMARLLKADPERF